MDRAALLQAAPQSVQQRRHEGGLDERSVDGVGEAQSTDAARGEAVVEEKHPKYLRLDRCEDSTRSTMALHQSEVGLRTKAKAFVAPAVQVLAGHEAAVSIENVAQLLELLVLKISL